MPVDISDGAASSAAEQCDLMRANIASLDAKAVTKPQPIDILRFAPQLSAAEVDQLLDDLHTGARRYFFGPGTAIDGTYQRYVLANPAKREPMIYRAGAGRLSRLKDGETQQVEMLGAPQAVDYGRRVFGDELEPDDAVAVLIVNVLFGRSAEREHTHTLACSLRTTFDVLKTWENEPYCEHLDDVLTTIVSAKHEQDELINGQPLSYGYFCGSCGGGLNGHVCSYCRIQYPTLLARPVTPYAIPYRAASLLMLDFKHKFSTDPRMARIADHRAWIEATLTKVRQGTPPEDVGYGIGARHLEVT